MKNTVKTLLFGLLAMVIMGCQAGLVDFAQTPTSPLKALAATTAVRSPTQTPTPTATIGYQATAAAAEATAERAQAEADAAARLMVQSTAEYEVRVQEQLRWTAQVSSWTVTAALTSVPLTSTSQSDLSTSIAKQQSLVAAQITQTKEAPTQQVAMKRAETEGKMVLVEVLARLFLLGALGYFLIAIGYFAIYKTTPSADKKNAEDASPPVREAQTSMVITVKNQIKGETPRWNRLVVPCGPAALSELACGVLRDGKSLRINNWEGKKSENWTRDSFSKMRNFLMANRYTVSDGSGTATLTDEGKAFLLGWLENGTLPHSYDFGGKDDEMPLHEAHEHEAHGNSHAVGEADLEKLPYVKVTEAEA